MDLKVLLPSHIFVEKAGVSRIVAETGDGSFGILPQRLDCVAVLSPGILTYESEEDGEVYVAVDEGVLVKAGFDVLISVRNAIAGENLSQLREAVDQEFLKFNAQEKSLRQAVAKMESGLIKSMAVFEND